MRAETIKLSLIERLMKVKEASTLRRMEELITQAEMEARTGESIKAVKNGDVLSIDEFGKENK